MFLLSQDIYLTATTGEHAHLVLPAAQLGRDEPHLHQRRAPAAPVREVHGPARARRSPDWADHGALRPAHERALYRRGPPIREMANRFLDYDWQQRRGRCSSTPATQFKGGPHATPWRATRASTYDCAAPSWATTASRPRCDWCNRHARGHRAHARGQVGFSRASGKARFVPAPPALGRDTPPRSSTRQRRTLPVLGEQRAHQPHLADRSTTTSTFRSIKDHNPMPFTWRCTRRTPAELGIAPGDLVELSERHGKRSGHGLSRPTR